MSDVRAEEISLKLKTLLEELSSLKVHSVILASFTSGDQRIVFGMEMNTSRAIAQSLLKAGSERVGDMRIADAPTH